VKKNKPRQSPDVARVWVGVVLLLDPRKARVTVYRSKSDIAVLEKNDVLELQDVLEGFSIALSRIFC
jgi:Uma2 family endonuclease